MKKVFALPLLALLGLLLVAESPKAQAAPLGKLIAEQAEGVRRVGRVARALRRALAPRNVNISVPGLGRARLKGFRFTSRGFAVDHVGFDRVGLNRDYHARSVTFVRRSYVAPVVVEEEPAVVPEATSQLSYRGSYGGAYGDQGGGCPEQATLGAYRSYGLALAAPYASTYAVVRRTFVAFHGHARRVAVVHH